MPEPISLAGRSPTPLRLRIALLLFGQYLIWGLWFVSLGSWLGATLHFSGTQIGMIYGTFAVAGLVTPMLGGAIADRFARTERMLALLHGVGGVLLLTASRQSSFAALYIAILLYALCYLPTVSLVPALGMRHLSTPSVEYPVIRTLGTFGWIVAGLVVGARGLDLTPTPLRLAGLASLALATYCLTLPATPPVRQDAPRGLGALLGFDALVLLRDPLFALFTVVSIALSVPSQFYNAFAALYLSDLHAPYPTMLLTVGQMSAVIVLLLLPRMYRALGSRRVLLVGAVSWATRSVLFAAGGAGSSDAAVYAGLLLHGLAYSCLYVAGQLMVHERAPEQMRAAAQGLMAVSTMGLGNLGGAWIAGLAVEFYTGAGGVRDWSAIWIVAAMVSMAATVGVMLSSRISDASVPQRST